MGIESFLLLLVFKKSFRCIKSGRERHLILINGVGGGGINLIPQRIGMCILAR